MVFGQTTEPIVPGPDVLTVENRLRAGYRLMTDPTPPSDTRELELLSKTRNIIDTTKGHFEPSKGHFEPFSAC